MVGSGIINKYMGLLLAIMITNDGNIIGYLLAHYWLFMVNIDCE